MPGTLSLLGCIVHTVRTVAGKDTFAHAMLLSTCRRSSLQVDKNGDGRIDYEEFCAMMRANDLDILKNAHEVGHGAMA